MSKAATKTDNSYFDAKVRLRLDNLPAGPEISVLDCFAGHGLLWRAVRRRAVGRKISVLSIDEKPQATGLHLVGDNMKFLPTMDLTGFNVIDLDVYGIPIKQLRLILSRPLRTGVTIFVTFIQSMFGVLPSRFLEDLGYTRRMIRRAPMLVNRNCQDKLLQWLALYGIQSVEIYSTADKKKTYLCMKINKDHDQNPPDQKAKPCVIACYITQGKRQTIKTRPKRKKVTT